MKFYEVMSQIVLTSHLVAFDLLTINLKTWQAMSPATQQAKVQAAADKAIAWSTAEHIKREAELAEGFRKQGLEVYVPEHRAFRELRAEGLSGLRRSEELACRHARQDQRHEVIAAAAGPCPRSCRRTVPRGAPMPEPLPLRTLARRAHRFAEAVAAVVAGGHLRRLHRSRSSSATCSTCRSAGPPSCRRGRLVVAGAVGRGLRAQGRGRDPPRPAHQRVSGGAHASAWASSAPSPSSCCSPCRLPAAYDYVSFMKVERTFLPEHPLRLAVLDLHHLRRRRDRALPVEAGQLAARPRTASLYATQAAPHREPHQPFLARAWSRSSRLSLLGVPIGHAMIGGSVLYLYLKGAGHGHRRRAAAQRHLRQLPAAGDPAVHPGGHRS